MSANYETSPRFFRPADVGRIRRNQRRIQVQRVLKLAFNVFAGAIVVLGIAWVWRQTQSDARFAVKSIEVAGATHTPRAEIDAITQRYVGLNLFQIDITRVQHDLGGLRWIRRIAIEKKLPDTLRILVVERTPSAIVQKNGALTYVDEDGFEFSDVSPSVGDADLPLIVEASGAELTRSVAFVRALRDHDRALYDRVSEVRPIAPRGFALFDRELATTVYVNDDDVSPKWRNLHAIAGAERLGRASIEYADLRFGDRIIIKPVHPITTATVRASKPVAAAQITN